MWRRGAPQRRGARGAFRGADAHTSCYGQLRGCSTPIPQQSFLEIIAVNPFDLEHSRIGDTNIQTVDLSSFPASSHCLASFHMV